MLRLKNCHQLLDFHPFWRPAVPVALELLDAKRWEPFSCPALLRKPDDFRDLGVVDARQVNRCNEEVHGTFHDRSCRTGDLVDIVPVHAGEGSGERRVERVQGKVDPVEPCSRKGRNPCIVEERAVCLERDDTHGVSIFERRNQLGETGIHERFARGIDVALDARSLEGGDLLDRGQEVLQIHLVTGRTGFRARPGIHRAERAV